MLNKIQIIGHLGRDPEQRALPSGAAVCNFSVATTEKWKNKDTGENVEETEWHRVSTFNRLAEVCGQYLTKGSLVYIEGKLKTRKYTDKDGVEKASVEIVASEMKMLGGKPQSDAPARSAAPAARSARPPVRQAAPVAAGGGFGGGFDDMDDDIPF